MFHLEKAKPWKILTHNDRKSFSEAVFHDPLKMLCTNIVYYHVFRVILLKTLRKKFYYWSCTAYQKKKKSSSLSLQIGTRLNFLTDEDV